MNRNLENAIVRLLKRRPFYGRMILNFRRIQAAGNAALGVTLREGVPTLTVNPAVFAELAPQEQEAVIVHGLKHVLHLHMIRRKGRNGHDWDIACDLAINREINGLPPGAPLPSMFGVPDGLAAEEYYRLLSSPFDSGNLKGQGVGNAARDAGGHAGNGGDPGCRPAATVDDHGLWGEADSTPHRLAEEVVRGMVREAWRQCDGCVPAEIRPLLEGYLAPPAIPWRRVLRQFVATAGRFGKKSTWMREHRRFVHDTPGIRKRQRLNLLVGVDVSDSTDAPELREAFARELLHMARGCDSLITVVYANSRIQRIDSFRGNNAVAESYHGGGFTDLRPLFDHAREMHPRPAAVVYLTDGIGPAPERMEFPTLWVLTREGERPAPWGVELRLGI